MVTQPSSAIVRFCIFQRVRVFIERIKIGEDYNALHLSGIVDPQMVRVRHHLGQDRQGGTIAARFDIFAFP
ncbi:hypothetical protein ASE05_30515 [Mesorhizobium sp. Root172]|nr:hypothetical protein ASE05_30515 [Mesorhizobium sp. Root172]